MAVDQECDNRNYLYGRLLAIADRIEYRTYDKEDVEDDECQALYDCIFPETIQYMEKFGGKVAAIFAETETGRTY